MRGVSPISVFLVGLGLFVPGRARAGAPDESMLLADIRAAQRDGDPTTEVARCQQVMDTLPQTRTARMCRGRLAQLAPRADVDGSYTGLARLQAIRSSPDGGAAPAAEVVDLAQAPTTGAVLRHDAWIWLARHHLVERDDPATALKWSEPLWTAWQEGSLLDDQADVAADVHARTLARLGRVAEAEAVEAVRQPARSSRPQEGVAAELRRQRMEQAHVVGKVGVMVFLIGSFPLAVQAFRRRGPGRPGGLVPLLVGGGAALVYAALWQAELARTVGAMVGWAAGAHLLTAQASGAVQGSLARLAVGLLGAVGLLSGCVWILHARGQLGLLL